LATLEKLLVQLVPIKHETQQLIDDTKNGNVISPNLDDSKMVNV
jgi:hypothetical protein